MAKVPGATTSSSSGSGDRSSTRRSTSELTTRSLRPAPRSAGISASTTPADRTRALTGRRRIEPISPGCRRSRRLEPGRGSTYRAGKTVRTDRASSNPAPATNLLLSSLSPVHLQTAVDREALAGHVVRVIGREIDRQLGDLLRLARAAPRYVGQFLPHRFRILDSRRGHRRVDQAGGDIVDVD